MVLFCGRIKHKVKIKNKSINKRYIGFYTIRLYLKLKMAFTGKKF